MSKVMLKDGKQATLNRDGQIVANTFKLDADGAFFFQRQLEYIKSQSYDVQYPQLKARMLFPVSNEAGEGATTITYRTYDQSGAAKIVASYAGDIPRSDVAAKETTIPVRHVVMGYGYSVFEIQAAARTGQPLDQRRANAARRGVEQTINDVAYFGDAEHGLPGLFTNPNIPVGNVPNGAGGTPEWSTKTPDEILADINNAFADIFENTNQVESGNTLLLPTSQWSVIMSTARSSTSDTTIAQYVANNSPYINSTDDMIPVNELNGAGTGGVDVMIAYDRSPEKLQLEIPYELKFQPVQEKGLEFEVPGHSGLGGLNVYYPLSINIVEDI